VLTTCLCVCVCVCVCFLMQCVAMGVRGRAMGLECVRGAIVLLDGAAARRGEQPRASSEVPSLLSVLNLA
jgi:hypothetical protein